jgi:hypothetical protein
MFQVVLECPSPELGLGHLLPVEDFFDLCRLSLWKARRERLG